MNENKYGTDYQNWPDYMLQTKINGQISNENNDAALIALISIVIAISTFILSASFIRYIVLIAFLLLTIQFILSSINIYIRFHPKYQTGNSYITRKLFTAALPYFMYSMIIPYIIVDEHILWVVLFFLPFIFCTPLINSLWRQFDNLSYAQIDSELPSQRRSFLESEEQAITNYNYRRELTIREANRFTSDNRDLEDIKIFRKDEGSGA